MAFWRSAQRTSYLINRSIGDGRAAKRGPKPLAKRLIRRSVTRSVFRAFR